MPHNRDLDSPDTSNPLFVGSVAKSFQVLEAFRAAGRSLTFTELCNLTKLEKSAVQRYCHTFAELGFIYKDPATKRFSPSPQMLDFAFTYLSSDPLIQIATPYLVDAREKGGEAMNLGRRMGTDMIYISRLPSKTSPLSIPLLGGRSPVFCTASGRAILSRLEHDRVHSILDRSTLEPLTSHTITDKARILDLVAQAADDGFTIASQECIVSEITVAAPIMGANGRVEGSVNIATSIQQYDPEAVRSDLAPIVTRAALEISRAMGMISNS
jgi:DNA-binding IclR family transcriptional regulator